MSVPGKGGVNAFAAALEAWHVPDPVGWLIGAEACVRSGKWSF